MGKKKNELTFPQKMLKLKRAGLGDKPNVNRLPNDLDSVPDLESRVLQVLGIINKPDKRSTTMMFFVMYDIESTKVRHQISKYLLRKGCYRIQYSIFLADLPVETYNLIKSDLAEVQSLYDNHDSIIVVPISTDYLQAMKIIGKSVNIDLITRSKNTLFF